MLYFWIVLATLAILALLVLLGSYLCYRLTFHNSPKKGTPEAILDHLFEPYLDYMRKCEQEVRQMPCKDVWITSFDGLRLHGRYYEHSPDSPIELMIHGYRSNALRDLSGGVLRCFQLGHSVLLIDQRSCGESEGHVITFGICEHKDCLSWLEFMKKEFGTQRKIILTGVSMGASTVLIAAGEKLPENVIGVLADCGYSNAKEIICSVIRSMKLPPKLLYPFVKLGAKLYGKFDLEETSSVEALRHSTVPVILIHGEDDDFVPCYMSQHNHDACVSRKRLVVVPGARHGLSYPVDPDTYVREMKNFFY